MSEKEERFKISTLLLSIFNLSAWAAVTYFYYILIEASGFHWTSFLYLPLYLGFSYIFFYLMIKCLFGELKKLGRKS